MAPATSAADDVENVDFLLTLIRTAKSFDPDFAAAAAAFNIATNQLAQRKFKAIAEKSGKYSFNKNIISLKNAADADTGADADTDNVSSTSAPPKTPKSKKRTAPTTEKPAAKQQKVKKIEEED